MKPLLIFFIATTSPVLLFFATLLYGDTTNSQLKTSIFQSGVYTQLSNYFAKNDNEADAPVLSVVKDRFTPEYLRAKTESAIDDSTLWITGKSQTPPVITLQELKQDLLKRNPELLTALENAPQESKLANADIPQEQQEAYLLQVQQISDFAKQDFTVHLDKYLLGFKTIYKGVQISLFVIAIMLLSCLFMIWKLAEGLPAKFKWIGITFVVTTLVGYGVVLSNTIIAKGIAQITLLHESSFIALITPIVLAILNHFMELYASYQKTAAFIYLGAAVLCFLGMILTRKQAVKTVKPLTVKRSYWEKP